MCIRLLVALQEPPEVKNLGSMRNFLLNFQATVRNKPGAKFSRAKNSRCKIPPPPVIMGTLEKGVQYSSRTRFSVKPYLIPYPIVLLGCCPAVLLSCYPISL